MTRFILLLAFAAFATGARADVPAVVTDIAPVHSLVARVMAGLGTADQIIRATASPHSYSLRPSEAAALERADLVIWIGPGLTPWMEKPLRALAGNTRQIALMEVDTTSLRPTRDDAIFSDHTDDHDHGPVDPHGWLDPMNGRVWLEVIAEELAVLDPENADLYRENAAAGQIEIDDATREAATMLATMKGAPFIVFHDAFQYFEARFDLAPIAAIFAGDGRAPGPARIAALRQLVQKETIACLITEPQFDPSFAELVLDGSDATVVELDPMGAAIDPGPGLYVALIAKMATGIAACE